MWRKKINPLQIGITGGIGSGKSLVCKIFNILGIPVYNSDYRAKLLYIQNKELKSELIQAFGAEAYTVTGVLNRSYLASQVFNDSQKVKLLNTLVHPKVKEDYETWVKQHNQFPYLIKEAALLIETDSYKSLDKIITVFTPTELRIQRISKRDTYRTEQEIKAIISKQISEEEKINKADYVIYNDEKHLLIPQVLLLHQQFMAKLSGSAF